MFADLMQRYEAWNARRQTRRDCHSELARLDASAHPLAGRLAAAVRNIVDGEFEAADRELVERIERLRRELSQSNETIEHVDYGAGQPDAPRDREEARKGVPVTLNMGRLATRTSKARPWSDLIYSLVRNLQPEKCLEMGTCIGLSAAYQCAALKMNGKGQLVTLEGGPALAETARANLASLGLSNFEIVVGPFEETLEPTLRKEQPIDFIFNDGHHDGEAMLAYFEDTLPYLADGAVMLFDDIAVYESMRDGWTRLTQHPAVDLSVDFGPMGLVCVERNAAPSDEPGHAYFRIPLA